MIFNIHNILCSKYYYCSYNTDADAKLELQRIKSHAQKKLAVKPNFISWLSYYKHMCLTVGVNVTRVKDYENKVGINYLQR